MSYRKRKDPECPIVLDSRGSSTLPQRDGKRQDPKSPPDKGKTWGKSFCTTTGSVLVSVFSLVCLRTVPRVVSGLCEVNCIKTRRHLAFRLHSADERILLFTAGTSTRLRFGYTCVRAYSGVVSSDDGQLLGFLVRWIRPPWRLGGSFTSPSNNLMTFESMSIAKRLYYTFPWKTTLWTRVDASKGDLSMRRRAK